MRSKWLDWKPGVEIIEKSPEPEPSKPTKHGFDGFVASPPATLCITRARIPQGAILVAHRFDGAGKPLASVPACWCCKTSYKLGELREWKGEVYAALEPGCGCLDTPQALACCGLCIEHCQCKVRTAKASAQKVAEDVFRTPQSDGDSQ